MTPARKGDGTGLSFPGYSEVRTGDGDVVWTAEADLPDSVIHQYLVGDFTTSNWTDSEGNEDITVEGLTLDTSAFGGSGGVVGDGADDYGQDGTMGTFGSQLDTNWALAFAISTTDSGDAAFISNWRGSTSLVIEMSPFNGTSSDSLTVLLEDDNGDKLVTETNYAINDGTERVFIINKTGNTAGDIEIYDSPTNNIASPDTSEAFDSVSDFSEPMTYFARPDNSTFMQAIMGDVFWFDDALDSTQRTDVFNDLFSWYGY